MKLWIVNYARRNVWRVPPWMDLDDLIAEGFLAYAIAMARYGDKVQNRRHFMSLLMIIFTNQITDLANERTACPEIAISQIGGEDNEEATLFERVVGGAEGDAELMALLNTAPDEIKKFLRLLHDPDALEKLNKPLRYRCGGQRDTTRNRIARMTDISPDYDVEANLRSLIAGDPCPENLWARFFKGVFAEMDNPIYFDTAVGA